MKLSKLLLALIFLQINTNNATSIYDKSFWYPQNRLTKTDVIALLGLNAMIYAFAYKGFLDLYKNKSLLRFLSFGSLPIFISLIVPKNINNVICGVPMPFVARLGVFHAIQKIQQQQIQAEIDMNKLAQFLSMNGSDKLGA